MTVWASKRPLATGILLFFLVTMLYMFGWGFEQPPDPHPNIVGKASNEVVTVYGRIYQIEQKQENLVVYISYKQSKTIIYSKHHKDLSIGNVIQATGSLSLFQKPRNPGNFNQQYYNYKQGIYGQVFAQEIEVTNESVDQLRDILRNLRILWKNRLIAVLGNEKGNLLAAVILGDKAGVDPEVKELYQKNGIGHILAISGLHISFLGFLCYGLLRRIGLSFFQAGVIGTIILITYALMVGLSISTIRAVTMFLLRVGADITGRVYDALTSLSVAVLAVILIRPMYLKDAGFLLSFGAVLGILWVYPFLKNLLPCSYRILDGVYAGMGINLALFPLLLYFYFEFPIYSFALNFAVIPLMSALLGLGVFGMVAYPIGLLPGPLALQGCGLILSLYEEMCRIMLKFPMNRMVLGQPQIWQVMLYYMILGGVIVISGHRAKRKEDENGKDKSERIWEKSVKIFVIFMAILIVSIHPIRDKKFYCTMVDVGQGDGIFLHDPNGLNYFFDGGSSDIKQVGKYRIEPYLKSQGVGVLDYVFLSHGDADHMNGIEEMLTRQELGVRIKALVIPTEKVQNEALLSIVELAQNYGTQTYVMRPGDSIGDRVRITCIQPGEAYNGTIGNASSMVLALQYNNLDILMTGDAEGEGVDHLVKQLSNKEIQEKYHLPKSYDILKVPHHGSRNGATEELVEVVAPKLGLISAGIHNMYGHPHQEIIKRLENNGSIVLSTQDYGAITIYCNEEKLSIKAYRTIDGK